MRKPRLKFTVYNRAGQPLIHFDTAIVQDELGALSPAGCIGCRFRRLPFAPGLYKVNMVLYEGHEIADSVQDAFSFSVGPGNFFGTGQNVRGIQDICLVEHQWWSRAGIPRDRSTLSTELNG